MNKTNIGLLFIGIGIAYGSLGFEKINSLTIGYLLKNQWIKLPPTQNNEKELFGSKAQIILFSLILNLIGIYILWNKNS